MRYSALIIVLFLTVFIIGCSKKGTSVTGLATDAGQITEAKATPMVQRFSGGCIDSDAGITKETAGKVSGVLNGKEYVLYDRCIAGFLIEYFCEDNTYKNQNFRCPSGTECLSGACRTV